MKYKKVLFLSLCLTPFTGSTNLLASDVNNPKEDKANQITTMDMNGSSKLQLLKDT